MKTKFLLLNIVFLLLSISSVSAADVKELFLNLPAIILKEVNKNKSIVETNTEKSLLKLKFPKGFSGEFKVLSEKKDETTVGLSVYSCDESQLEIWSLKKGNWKEITDSAVPKLGEKDVVEMLKVSPATIEKLSEAVSIPYFFTFDSTNDLQLIVRKQTACEIAGKVYKYKFNGKKFIKE